MTKEEMIKHINEEFDNYVKKGNLCLTKNEHNIVYDAMVEGTMLGLKLAQIVIEKNINNG